jgi:hypothetical protein
MMYSEDQRRVLKMSVVRVNKTKNYTVLSNHHFKEKRMSLKAKGLLSLMLSLPDDWNYSISGLVTLSKDGKDSVMSALSELEKFGYLARVKLTNEKGQFAGVEYNIYEMPPEVLPSAAKQNEEKPKEANANEGKPPQLNTNNSITNNNKIIYNINNYINTLDAIGNDRLRNTFVDFLEHRNRLGQPLTVKGFELLVERVRELAGLDVDKQIELLRVALINNWKNVYPKGDTPIENDVYSNLKDFYS